MEPITIDQPSVTLAPAPRPRRRSSRSIYRPAGIRKNSTESDSGSGSPLIRNMGRMASILGSSSPDVSPTTSAPQNGLPGLRDSFPHSLSSSSPNGGGGGGGSGGGGGTGGVNGGGGGGSHSNGGGSTVTGNGSENGGSNNRERAPSQSSDRDIAMTGLSTASNGTNGSVNTPTSRKRQSVDGVEYPRRRATIAVSQPHTSAYFLLQP